MKASWNKQVIADSDDTTVIENNHYFPIESINSDFFEPSEHRTICPWKGTAHYFDIVVNGERNKNAAWFYPETKEAASNIEGRIAFWNGVDVGE